MITASIVICTFNRAALLEKTLKVLEAYYRDRRDIEIILVDNNSSDNTQELAERFPWAHYCFEEKPGLSNARNRGISESSGALVIFLDDDAYPDQPIWLDNYIRFFANHPDCAAAGGEVMPEFETPPPAWITGDRTFEGYLSILKFPKTRPIKFPELPIGANIAYRRSLLQEVGDFNPSLGRVGKNLLSNEEVMIQIQAEDSGHKFYYLKGVEVNHFIHQERLTRKWFMRRFFWQGKSDRLSGNQPTPPLAQFFKSLIHFFNPLSDFKKRLRLIYLLGFYAAREGS
jgi:glycosyltransferase involved in cell wall biosynthesis